MNIHACSVSTGILAISVVVDAVEAVLKSEEELQKVFATVLQSINFSIADFNLSKFLNGRIEQATG